MIVDAGANARRAGEAASGRRRPRVVRRRPPAQGRRLRARAARSSASQPARGGRDVDDPDPAERRMRRSPVAEATGAQDLAARGAHYAGAARERGSVGGTEARPGGARQGGRHRHEVGHRGMHMKHLL